MEVQRRAVKRVAVLVRRDGSSLKESAPTTRLVRRRVVTRARRPSCVRVRHVEALQAVEDVRDSDSGDAKDNRPDGGAQQEKEGGEKHQQANYSAEKRFAACPAR